MHPEYYPDKFCSKQGKRTVNLKDKILKKNEICRQKGVIRKEKNSNKIDNLRIKEINKGN